MLWLLLLALAPGLVLFLFFYFRDRYRKEPAGALAVTFVLGALAVFPAMAVSFTLQRLTGWSPHTPNLLHAFAGAIIIVGLVEEGWKFLVVRFYSWHRREFDEPYDGIMYSITAALGFATLENILYVLTGGFGVGVMRAFLAVPAHAFNGVVMGYFLGEAKFAGTIRRSHLLSATALGLAVLAHGVYDFIVFTLARRPLMLVNLVVFAVLTWVLFFEATRRQAEKSARAHPALSAARRDLLEPEPDRPPDRPDSP
uniref:Protease PrsW n=1 Tax=candidate division WOR-3 bacterium TaxID=2052148 RepID=A0A7C4CA68_UNCW3